MNKVRPTDLGIKRCLICSAIDVLIPFQYEFINLLESVTNLKYAQFALKKHICQKCVINASAAYYFYEQCHFSYKNIIEDEESLSNENTQRGNKTSNAEKLPNGKANFLAKKNSSKDLNAKKMLATSECYVNIEVNKLAEELTEKKLQGIKEESSNMPQTCQLRREMAKKNKTKVASKRRPMKLRSSKVRKLKRSCPICKKQYKSDYFFKNHVKGHNNSRKFKCAICHKKFKIKNTFNRHKAAHKEEKPYGCQICGARFFQKFNLKCHQRTHREPFECKCGMLFKLKSIFLRHLKKCAVAKSAF